MAETTPLPRDQFPVTRRHHYLNHAGVAPLPVAAVDAVAAVARDFLEEGGLAVARWDEHQERVRARVAALMGVPVHDVAFVKNTTEGLGFVANGLTWHPGDRVVVPDHEFPSTLYPWLALADRGVRVDLVAPRGEGGALPLECFAEALEAAPTKLVATSWVQFGRGWRTDLAGLAALCHEHGALLCADVIQGLGVIPADLEAWGVDFAMADSHKWMVGPVGIGAMYVARRNRDLLRPLEPGWASVAHREEWDNLELVWDESARRFEGGTPNSITIAGMGASVDLLLDAGVEQVWRHVDSLCDRLVEGLRSAGATVLTTRPTGAGSGIVTFTIDGRDPPAVSETLRARGIVCSPRGGGVRASPHGYTTTDDVDALVEAVGALRGA